MRSRVLSSLLSLALPLLACASPVDVKSAPESPVKSCQLAFECARECVDCIGDTCSEDSLCVSRCMREHEADSPCGGERPAAVGVDAAWGCQDGELHDDLFETRFVPGLCPRENISVCGCRWSAYDCTQDQCEVDGLTGTGSDTEGWSGSDTDADTDTDTSEGGTSGDTQTGTGTDATDGTTSDTGTGGSSGSSGSTGGLRGG